MRDERPLTHKDPLQNLVERNAQNSCQRHHDGRTNGRSAEHQGQRQDEDVPDHAVTEATGNLKHLTGESARGSAIQLAANTVLGGVHAR